MPRSPCLCVCVCVRRGGMLQGTEGKFSPPSKAADKWQGRCAKERGEEGSRRMRKEGRGRRGRRGSGTAPAVGAASPGGMERLPPPTPGEAPPACRGWERVPLRLRGGGPAVGSGPCRAAGVGGGHGMPYKPGVAAGTAGGASRSKFSPRPPLKRIPQRFWELHPIRRDWRFPWKSSSQK